MDITGHEMGLMLASAPGIGGGTPANTTTTTGTPGGTQGAGGGAQQSPFGGGFLFIMIGMIVFMIVMSTMTSRKEKKKRNEMLSSLGRHDRIVTTGGMIGTVVEIKSDEVVIKVDESTNTRIHFNRAAVQSVLKHGKGGGSSDEVVEEASEDAFEPAETVG